MLAGLVGIEPTHGRIKIFCLTAWLQANNGGQSWIRTNETGVADLQSAAFGHFAICPNCHDKITTTIILTKKNNNGRLFYFF